MCVCMSIHIYIYIHIYTYIPIHVFIYICIYVFVCVHVHVYVQLHVYVCALIFGFMFVFRLSCIRTITQKTKMQEANQHINNRAHSNFMQASTLTIESF